MRMVAESALSPWVRGADPDIDVAMMASGSTAARHLKEG
jgi:hypothetical protein